MTASQRIRASIEALPEELRTVRWTSRPAQADETPGLGEYWALMGPHVGEKVAALLEAHQRIRDAFNDVQPTAESAARRARNVTKAYAEANEAALDLARAIEGEQR